MSSVLVTTIVEDTLNSAKYSYANIETVKQVFKNIEANFSLDAIYDRYIKAKNDIERLATLQETCTSDYVYWSYIAERETNQLITTICAKLLLSKINLDDLAEIKIMEFKSLELDSLKAQIRTDIDGLAKYKPSGYKSKIELLKSYLGGSK